MPLVAHNDLPAFKDLHNEGQIVLSQERAKQQDIRALHVGLLNMMPDAALVSTERQFFRLIGASNPIAQFRVHPFALAEQERGEEAQKHIDAYYETFDEIKAAGLDALIITGANVTHAKLPEEAFWEPLIEVSEWAYENVTSTLCSCLATHAVLEARHKLERHNMGFKRWGVFPHRVVDKTHPLVSDINTRFDVPHSRYNTISRERFENANLKVLVEDEEGSVHLAVSADGIRTIYFQGHPEYDTISLLKEYKREVIRFQYGARDDYPPFPSNYFNITSRAVFDEYEELLRQSMIDGAAAPIFPEHIVSPNVDNTWHDSGLAVIGNWMGLVYQITHSQLDLPFMEGIDPDAPLLYLE